MRLLLIEDDPDLANVICKAFREYDFCVDLAEDGSSGLHKAMVFDYDVIVLDLMLPGIDGTEVLNRLRKKKSTPVLVLTARDTKGDAVAGLNLGADDYVTKPFDLEELVARIRALIRRSSNNPSPLICVGDVSVDTLAQEVFKANELVSLTAKEYAVLHLLLVHRGKVVSRSMIYDGVYGEHDDTLSNVVDVYIANLRKRLGASLIRTRRGQGYIIRD